MTTLHDVERLVSQDHGLATVATTRADGSVQSSVVNAGVLAHPLSGRQVLGFVAHGRVKLANLRARPRLAVTIRSGWNWATVEGTAELYGPDDPDPRIDAERLRLLLREVFSAAGGTHDDWDTYDRVMAADRRCVVLVQPGRCYGNPA